MLKTQQDFIPKDLPQKRKKFRSSLIGRSSQPEVEATPQLPLAEGLRSELLSRREEVIDMRSKGKSSKQYRLPRRPKLGMSWYTSCEQDFPVQSPKPSPELLQFMKQTGPMAKLEVSPDSLSHMEAVSCASLVIASHTDWFLGTAHTLLESTSKGLTESVLEKLEHEQPVSKEDVQSLLSTIKGASGLLSSVAKAYEDRLAQDTYLFWCLHLLRHLPKGSFIPSHGSHPFGLALCASL